MIRLLLIAATSLAGIAVANSRVASGPSTITCQFPKAGKVVIFFGWKQRPPTATVAGRTYEYGSGSYFLEADNQALPLFMFKPDLKSWDIVAGDVVTDSAKNCKVARS